jgi:hypothetical protein
MSPQRSKFTLTRKSRSLRKQQGQFVGLVRNLPKSIRRALCDLRRAKGYEAAIKAAKNEWKGRDARS